MMPILAAGDPTAHILPHDLFKIGPIWVTNHMLMATVAAILMLLVFPLLFGRSFGLVPTGARNFFESILEFLRVEVFRPALKEKTDRFVPFLWTTFFFILFCNLLGFLPLGEILGFLNPHLEHYAGTATGNINTTFALALSALIMIHVSGIIQVAKDLMAGTYGHHDHHEEHSSDGKPSHEAAHDLPHVRGEALAADVPNDFGAVKNPTGHYHDDEHYQHHESAGSHVSHGHGAGVNPIVAILLAVPLYLWNFAPHPFKPKAGESKMMWIPDVLVWGMLLGLELIGAAIKPFALMIRLFANMIAGHLVLAVLITFIPVTLGVIQQTLIGVPITVLSLLIRLLELFVCFLQAYIFTFLTTLFIASAVAPEH